MLPRQVVPVNMTNLQQKKECGVSSTQYVLLNTKQVILICHLAYLHSFSGGFVIKIDMQEHF